MAMSSRLRWRGDPERTEAVAAAEAEVVVDGPEIEVEVSVDGVPANDTGRFPIVRGGQRLGELLLDSRAIKRAQLKAALKEQASSGALLGEVLSQMGAVDEARLVAALAAQSGLDLIDLRDNRPEADLIELVPERVARQMVFVPVRRVDGGVIVAASEPMSAEDQATLSSLLGAPVTVVLARPSDVRRVIDTSYRAVVDVDRHVQAFVAAELQRTPGPTGGTGTSIEADAPVVQIVQLLFTQALRDRASDVHIEPQDDQLRVRFRVDGALHDVLSLPVDLAPALVSRVKIMAGMNIVERRRSQDGQIALNLEGRSVDVRVSTIATIWGEKCVMRILDKSRSMYRLGQLGMPEETHATYSRIIRSPFGMVLCAGPTGSGKTTTLYASLMEINEPDRNIMTIEDPVEYVVPSINQIQANEAAGITFAGGLKAILRQDPDVILVGEIRDVETARIATQSALTGHFVLSTLHATDAVAALHRLLDMGIESFLIASSVIAVVGQRLVRRICQYCVGPYQPTAEELAFFEDAASGTGSAKAVFVRGAGCNFCAGTGYQDRVGVYELLRITPEIKRLVVGWATQEELHRLAIAQGMRTLREEAIELVRSDVTTISEVIRSIYMA
jgi:type IV pilus assembly protein PilB